MRARFALIFPVLFLLGACAGTEPRLVNPGGSAGGPDEFSILPGKPLQAPEDYTALPEPTPGGTNLADRNPDAEAVAALGGRPSLLARSGIPAADRALLAHVSRYGVPADLRETLAREDAALRRGLGLGLFARWFGGNRYFAIYRRWALDPFAELARLRAAGVKTPSAPAGGG